jgi:tetratricopeptide (TPR) repeat protein
VLLSVFVVGSIGCEQLDGRNKIRIGNRLFRETQFIDSAAEYEAALKEVDDPIVHYNLGLAYQKVVKTGFDGAILLGTKDEFVCQQIPGARVVEAGACVKPGDRHYAECGAAKTGPLEKAVAELEAQVKSAPNDDKKKELEQALRDKQDELMHYTCSSSFHCVEGSFCALNSPEIADLAAQHLQTWIKAQSSDEEIKKQLNEAVQDLDEAKKADNKQAGLSAQRRVDDLELKDLIRKLMTRLWTDTDQHRKALDYWEGLLKDKPNDAEIMGNLAGINLKAGDWRKSIEWYNKVADVTNDPSSKVAAYQFIGNVAWSKLNSRTLIGPEAVELADRGIGALQRAAEVQPKNPRLVGLQASIFNFRSTAHGASLAGAIDRATAQDLLKLTRVLADEAKKAQGLPPGTPPAEATPAPANPANPATGTNPAGAQAPAGAPAPAGGAAPASGAAPPTGTAPHAGAAPAAPAGAAPAGGAAPATGGGAATGAAPATESAPATGTVPATGTPPAGEAPATGTPPAAGTPPAPSPSAPASPPSPSGTGGTGGATGSAEKSGG